MSFRPTQLHECDKRTEEQTTLQYVCRNSRRCWLFYWCCQ